MEQLGQALYVAAGLFWKAFWALALGYAFSSLIQVLVPREIIAKYLGRAGLKQTVLGMLLGPRPRPARLPPSRPAERSWQRAPR